MATQHGKPFTTRPPSAPRVAVCTASLAALGALVLSTSSCRDDELVRAGGQVKGQVCNPVTGRPAVGADVSVTFFDEDTSREVTIKDTSDDTGSFRLDGLPEGSQTVDVKSSAFESSFDIDIVVGDTALKLDPACRDLAPDPGNGTIVGQVCNRHTGEFIRDGEVLVLLPDGSELSTTTDPATGNFELEVPAGTHIVYVRGTGFQKTYTVKVEEDETTTLDEQVAVCAPPDPLSTGFITGKICAPDPNGGTAGGGPLSGAHVTATWQDGSETVVIDDETLEDGSFTLNGIGPTPAQNVQVRAEKGAFSYTFDAVNVFSRADNPDGVNLTADIACEPLVPDDGRKYLVVDGTFDKIQQVLDRMDLQNVTLVDGVPVDISELWTQNVFGNYDELAQYDVVFVNCGVSEVDWAQGLPSQIKANIRQFIAEGGSLYVSDWAYELVEQTFPEQVDFLFDDAEVDAAQYGVQGDYTADVLEPGLREYVGQDNIDVNFNFGFGAVVSRVAPGVQVFLQTDMQYVVNGRTEILPDTPITVGFHHGAGKVIFTSFHQETNTDGTTEQLDGPEDLVLRYLIFSL